MGFQNVISAEGNVRNLKELIIRNFSKENGKIIYFSGETISFNLDALLIKEGYSLDRVINYKTEHLQFFDEKFIEKLKISIPDIVYIYSENSASSFLNFIKNYQSESLWMNTNLMCIGEKTSTILNEIKWKKIFLLILEKKSFCYIKFEYGFIKKFSSISISMEQRHSWGRYFSNIDWFKFFIFLIFRGLISKLIIKKLEII